MNAEPDQPGATVREVEIEKLAGGGAGLARVEGEVWLVGGAYPGERVRARPVRRHRGWTEAVAEEVLAPSPDRRTPPCPLQPRCGGCAWMPLGEEAQRTWKRQIVVEDLARLGGLRDAPVEPTIASPSALGYRNKVELTLGAAADGRPILGYHAPGGLLDVERCLLQDDLSGSVLATARAFLLDPSRTVRTREPLRLVIRRSSSDGTVLVAVRGGGEPLPWLDAFAIALRQRHPEVCGVVRLVAHPGRRGGARTVTVSGRAWIHERLAGTDFELPASVFFQVNPGAAELLASTVLFLAGTPQHVLELYGGVGVFSLALARNGASAVVCEVSAEAVTAGRRAASRAGLPQVRFVRDDVARLLISTTDRFDLVLADPPRAGLGRTVVDGIAALRPPRLIVVSCDPATLARDVKWLREHGYAVERVVPIDLFPQTPHVETVTLLSRIGEPTGR